MQFGVNLLEQRKVSPGESQSRRRLKRLGVIVLLVYTLCIAILFAFSFYLTTTQKKLNSEKQQVEAKIKNFEKRESLALDLKRRAEMIGKILASRENVQKKEVSQEQLLAWIKSITIPGISLTKISLGEAEITFEAEAANALVLGEFLDQLQSTEKKILFLSLDTLSRTPKGTYGFSLKANFL